MEKSIKTIKQETINYIIVACSLGKALIARSNKGLCAVLISENKEQLVMEIQNIFPKANLKESYANIISKKTRQILNLLDGNASELCQELDIRGTIFQKQVWQLVMNIPKGQTTTYQCIAENLGLKNGARAVAKAVASNILALIIPCHRVIRTNGEYAGFRWGVERKKILLERESQSKISSF